MPRFYFDLYNSIGATIDPEGRDLPDLEAARVTALDDIRSLLSSEVRHGEIDLRGHVVIRGDGDGESEVARIPFDEAIDLRHSP